MKKLICIIAISIASLKAISQTAPAYKYYFLVVQATERTELQIDPEMGVDYGSADKAIVEKRETNKKGEEMLTGKKYATYSALFTALSETGIEFVQFADIPAVSNMTAWTKAFGIKYVYMVWRRSIN